MDCLNTYRQIICNTLKPYVDITYANVSVKNRAAFDQETDQYIILSEGWDHQRHLHCSWVPRARS
jgi:XisI protein